MSNRRCPKCSARFAAPARFCVNDGTPLVEDAPDPAASAAPPPSASAPISPAPPRPESELRKRYATLSGQVLDHRYVVGRKLGEGGMSYVYQAQDLLTGETVAVKILIPRLSRDPGSIERLRREATIAMRLDHPNVCPILRLGETEAGMIYLVMPYLEGEPLSEHETRRGALSPAEGVPLLVQICHGLQHAHDLHIVHRDLKPENVMLVPEADGSVADGTPGKYRAVVMDFGLAKERRAGPEVAKLTATGVVLGTPEFMSPEQIRGKPLDGRSDVYALGILAFEMLTGRLPFAGKSAQDTMIARLRDRPLMLREANPDLPARLEAVVSRALSLNPEDRFQSMMEMAEALQSASAPGMFARLFGR